MPFAVLAPIQRPVELTVLLVSRVHDSSTSMDLQDVRVLAPPMPMPHFNAPLKYPSLLCVQGGGLVISGGTVTMTSCSVYSNTATYVSARLLNLILTFHRPNGMTCGAPVCAGRRALHRSWYCDADELFCVLQHSCIRERSPFEPYLDLPSPRWDACFTDVLCFASLCVRREYVPAPNAPPCPIPSPH